MVSVTFTICVVEVLWLLCALVWFVRGHVKWPVGSQQSCLVVSSGVFVPVSGHTCCSW